MTGAYMVQGIDDSFIAPADRYTSEGAKNILLKLAEAGTPLPLLIQEVYAGRRLVFYSDEDTCRNFISTVNSFLFYFGGDIIFCSARPFRLSGGEYEWTASFGAVEQIKFEEGDLFFAFDFSCRKDVIDHVREQKVKGLAVEAFRKAFIGALYHYAQRIRPVINFAALHPGVQIVLIDNFQIPRENHTKWEKYIIENHLTRERMVERLKRGEVPYPDGLYSRQYSADELLQMHKIPERTSDARNVLHIQDTAGRFVNVENGMRKTVGQPLHYKRTIHVFGGCGFFGVGLPDEATFASQLQHACNAFAQEENFRVVNRGCFIWGCQDAMWYLLASGKYEAGDIVVLPYNQKWAQFFYKNSACIRYADITERSEKDGEIFNDTWHPSENGVRVYVNNLFDFLRGKNFFRKDIPDTASAEVAHIALPKQFGIPPFADSAICMSEGASAEIISDGKAKAQLEEYLANIGHARLKIGAIVMNCNPFTLGHRYLIEYASKRVDKLYIFAVEEDKSYFPFRDRIELIRQGTADLPNVTVLPSGKFIISSLTFTDYFGKAEKQDKQIDASADVEIFGRYIAPSLGINIRFVGEEPLDRVTKQYNEQMQQILPRYGVAVEEVPRKSQGGEVISASRVRKLLQQGLLKEIKPLVPATTYEYLSKRFKHH